MRGYQARPPAASAVSHGPSGPTTTTSWRSVAESGDVEVRDLGCDVRVGLLDAIAEDVSEPSGLGDLGDPVGDHPGLMAVPEPVEGESGLHWVQPYRGLRQVRGAVHGRA